MMATLHRFDALLLACWMGLVSATGFIAFVTVAGDKAWMLLP